VDTTATNRRDGADQRTLLIIDDDEDWTELLRNFFLDKYNVEVANLSSEAVEMACKRQPSLIIVDLVMPQVDGFGILRRLSDASQSHIPTILLTGWKSTEVEECAESFGCVAVLAKPISLYLLDQIVSSALSNQSLVKAQTFH
jgi:CheY-like chemotaxis protein